ncbi:hypothetical protein TanjilG_10947 [Lupinus angustifolius]|uniref:Uncharacterized protein n=1 Tax=Lupinus angustifolius TaxID=3871 RepID=A0A1J7IA85_LUPAN|nr:hypothetical protein TanjilG_10947 [Lupinus angustifolius]
MNWEIEKANISVRKFTYEFVACGFFGPIQDSIGSLKQLAFLALNSNRFNRSIPHSIGNLSNVNWLDRADNQLEGRIPISDGQRQLGLDPLLKAQHLSWEFLGLEKYGRIPTNFAWRKASFGEKTFIANIDTGVENVVGDMFQSVPKGDAIFMKRLEDL